jgi:hypothetical protein
MVSKAETKQDWSETELGWVGRFGVLSIAKSSVSFWEEAVVSSDKWHRKARKVSTVRWMHGCRSTKYVFMDGSVAFSKILATSSTSLLMHANFISSWSFEHGRSRRSHVLSVHSASSATSRALRLSVLMLEWGICWIKNALLLLRPAWQSEARKNEPADFPLGTYFSLYVLWAIRFCSCRFANCSARVLYFR